MSNRSLTRIKLRGYRSIAECDLKMRMLNILIGANGSGKSNFIGFFELIPQMLLGNLQKTMSKAGGADALLHFGRKKTASLQAEICFGDCGYLFSLEPNAENCMIYADERLFCNEELNIPDTLKFLPIGSGHFESGLDTLKDIRAYNDIVPIMKNLQVYHFHDTGESSPIRQPHSIHDNDNLRSDAGNLAAYLYDLQQRFPDDFQIIAKSIRLVAPFFEEFVLHPQSDNPEMIELEWLEADKDTPFKAHRISDGMLRFICLATLLLQPSCKQPEIIIIDEPELGLHPYAITVLAGLLKSASHKKQIIVSTQCADLISEFSPDDIIIANRENNQSILKRLESDTLRGWLEEYSLGDLWKRNLLGGRPS
ncbi:MAG: AAA family ATPase [Ectothiorhodospiraceae bacterium AqS1]|nr:AAA family ATPase [Ectothiorhodospiraceae bacterium AqS1]